MPSLATNSVRRAVGISVALVLAGLTGCASTLETAFVAPGKFDIYTCQDIEERAKVMRAREQELQQLMTRAAQGPGGGLVNAIAYNSDYVQAKGELKLLEEAASTKQCASQSNWTSQRSVF